MPRPVEFSFWGPPNQAAEALERDLERAAALSALTGLLRRRPAALWGAALVAYLSAWGLLWVLAPLWWLPGALLLHLLYTPCLLWAARHVHREQVLEEERLANLRQWLHQVGDALPQGCTLDLTARLAAGGCRDEANACAKPWLQARCALPRGAVLELQALEGRACSNVRHDVAPGSTRLTLRLCGEEPGHLRRLARQIRRQRHHSHDLSHDVLLETPYRLRWSVMLRGVQDQRLPTWPLAQLLEGWQRAASPRPAPPEAFCARPAAPGEARGARSFSLYAPSPTWRELRSQARHQLARALPSPWRVSGSAILVINGLLGLSFLGLGRPQPLAGWALGLLGGALLLGGASGVKLWWLLRPRGVTTRGPIGQAYLGQELLELSSGLQPPHRVDFAQPLRAHLTRDPEHHIHQGRVRVHLCVVQRQGERLERARVSTWLPWSDALEALPVKEEEAPLMEPEHFQQLWEGVREAIALHSAAPARVLEVQRVQA